MREVIQALRVWDPEIRRQTWLQPGTIVRACCVRLQVSGEEGIEEYSVELEWEGHRYTCPLFRFQPRTQLLDSALTQRARQAQG